MRSIFTLLIGFLCTQVWASNFCPGWDEPQTKGQAYEIFLSPTTHHWSDSPEHKRVWLVSLRKNLPNDRFCGLSLFSNSFGQPSAYAHLGKTWPHVSEHLPDLYAGLSAGILYGYVGKYKHKVPLNVLGFSPAVIPSLGYRITPSVGAEIQILGTAAVMFGVSYRF